MSDFDQLTVSGKETEPTVLAVAMRRFVDLIETVSALRCPGMSDGKILSSQFTELFIRNLLRLCRCLCVIMFSARIIRSLIHNHPLHIHAFPSIRSRSLIGQVE